MFAVVIVNIGGVAAALFAENGDRQPIFGKRRRSVFVQNAADFVFIVQCSFDLIGIITVSVFYGLINKLRLDSDNRQQFFESFFVVLRVAVIESVNIGNRRNRLP